MTNPPLSSGFPTLEEVSFTLWETPNLDLIRLGEISITLNRTFLAGMMPNQPYMNQPGGGPYNPGQGHGVYQNPGWPANPQAQSFPGGWGQMSQPRLPFLAHLICQICLS
jgi:hypothetical protein